MWTRCKRAVAIMNALYAENVKYQQVTSKVPGIKHPYLNIGRIEGGTNTNVIPGKVVLKIDRRMIPEENPAEVEGRIRAVIAKAVEASTAEHGDQGADACRDQTPAAGQCHDAAGRQCAAGRCHPEAWRSRVWRPSLPAVGTPLYTDVRLYVERGIPGVIYGAGPRTVLESHAKRADERLQLEDLRRATKVVARSSGGLDGLNTIRSLQLSAQARLLRAGFFTCAPLRANRAPLAIARMQHTNTSIRGTSPNRQGL